MKKGTFTTLTLIMTMFFAPQSGFTNKIQYNYHTGNHVLTDVSAASGGTDTTRANRAAACGTYTVSDASGNVYSTVQIGDQCWMGENLRVGIMIPGTTNQANNGIIEKHCYGDLLSNCNTYGGLYQWGELMQYSGQPKTQGICPTGWNIPASGDFQWLGYLVGDSAGGKLKTTGTIESSNGLWYAPNTMATNSSGFSAVPGGWKDESGNFENMGYYAFFYTSQGWWDCCAYFMQLSYNDGYIFNSSWVMRSRSLSVRCIKNAATTATVSTSSISGIAATTAVGGGNVTNDGGEDVTARGVVWSTTHNPTVVSYVGKTMNGTGVGMFTSNLLSLVPGTTYYVRAYATNSIGTAYGAEVGFMTIPSILTVSGLIVNAGTDTCFNAAQTLTVTNVTVKNGGSATFISGGKILLQPLTKVENGGHLHARITTSQSYCLQPTDMMQLNSEIKATELQPTKMPDASALFTIFPNPTTGNFRLEMHDFDAIQAIQVEISTMMGERVLHTELPGQQRYEFNFTDMPTGVYLIRVVAGDKMSVGKLIKQ